MKLGQPKYEQAKSHLRETIKEMSAGTKLPSVQALHECLGISPGTVTRAIDELVREGVLERRKNAGAFVSYPRNANRTVLVVWTDLIEQVTGKPLSVHPYTSRILHSVQEEASNLDRNLLITRKLLPAHQRLDGGTREFSGVLVLFNYDRRFIESFASQQIPVVLIEPLVRVPGVGFVTTDHCEDTREATQYLIRKGHRRIVYVAIDNHLTIHDLKDDRIANYVIHERIRGYELAMREGGLDEFLCVFPGPSETWEREDKNALLNALRKVQATACCCFNDDIAARVLATCRENGMIVPDDISIVGHDDVGIARVLHPGLTTVKSPLTELGYRAMRLLNEQISTSDTTRIGIVIPSTLTERESVKAL